MKDELEQLLIQRDILSRLYVKYGGMSAYKNDEMDKQIQKIIGR